MRVDLLTREYPPEVYGGAGVHVEHLAAELRPLCDLRVRCFEADPGAGSATHRTEPGVSAFRVPGGLETANAAIGVLGVNLEMAAACEGTDLVHSHTWYTQHAGHLARLLHDVPHVTTTHSLEPHRPWKAEQLGGGYRISSWVERTAVTTADLVITVSEGMRRDVLACYPELAEDRVTVIYNGIDTERYAPDDRTDVLERYAIDPDRPLVVFIGRITRQKGLPYLLRAADALDRDVQLMLCAGAPDTPEIAAEVNALVGHLREERHGVIWIDEMLPRQEVIQILSHTSVFVFPSVYEPMGIVNLEAMACEAAVVATATGGIPEVVVDGETGLLVPIEQVSDGTGTPLHPERFVADLAERINALLGDHERAAGMGRAGRH